MKLTYVTLTGADNTVKPSQLAELSKKYPYVEWAILFSQKKSGQSRYPTLDWIDELVEVQKTIGMNLSAHLCGKWVDDVMAGCVTFLHNKDWDRAFDRIQLNMGKERLQQAIKSEKFLNTIKDVVDDHQIILGGNYKYIEVPDSYFWDNVLFPLFDASGGRGIETKDWPKPHEGRSGLTMLTGYAGGLGPDNVAAQLKNIANVAKGSNIWIDMETKLRGDRDEFDLDKCEEVLKAVKEYV